METGSACVQRIRRTEPGVLGAKRLRANGLEDKAPESPVALRAFICAEALSFVWEMRELSFGI